MILSLGFIGLTAFNFGGTLLTTSLVLDGIFNVRQSDMSVLNDDMHEVFACRRNFANLAQRETFTFDSEGSALAGYYYAGSTPKANIVCYHGMGELSDGYNAMYQSYFLEAGYNVYAIDFAGSGNSEGTFKHGFKTPCENVVSSLNYLKETKFDNNLPLILIGHSVGAFAISVACETLPFIDGIITFSGFDCPNEIMMEYARQKAGWFADMTKPSFIMTSNMKYGDFAGISASKILKNAVNVASLHFHGDLDNNVPKGISLLRKAKENNLAATFVELENVGHAMPWVDPDSYAFGLSQIESSNNVVDKEKTSRLSRKVFDEIDSFLLRLVGE